jgi:hypothetical protein
MPLPTMRVAGVQKCGTDTIRTALSLHPEIWMTRQKEIHFFDRHFARGVDWYSKHFHPKSRHSHFGEATPDYIHDPETRGRLTDTLPDTKLIIILRDPVDRAYSAYWHITRRGWEDKSFEEAMELEAERTSSPRRRERSRFNYVGRGHYIDTLLSLEEKLGRDHLHVVLLDDMKADQAATLEAVFKFLDIDPEPAHTIPEQWRNKPRVYDPELGKKVGTQYPPMDPETRAGLAKVYQDSNRRLGEWLGRDLPWTTV